MIWAIIRGMDHTESPSGGGLPQVDAEQAKGAEVVLSTSYLTDDQAAAVTRWIDRMRTDRPLPGVEAKGPMLRMIGIDDRPPCSLSDVIGAAVADLLNPTDRRRRRLDLLDIAKAAEVARLHARNKSAARGSHRPAWITLRGALAVQVKRTPKAAAEWLDAQRRELYDQAAERWPREDQTAQRQTYVFQQMAERGIPLGLYTRPWGGHARNVPAATIPRMGIDLWARRDVDRVLLAAIEFAEETHEQRHRLRYDAEKRL